jgi:hypothetical protein
MVHRAHRPLALALAAGLAVLAAGAHERTALAQPTSEARAEAAVLFEDGRRLMSESKFVEACPKLEESQRLDPGMGTLFQVSACYEAIGRTASAWVGFRDVAGQAATTGQADREKLARGKASALEAKLMRLRIAVAPNGTSGIEVKRDGAVVSPALWGTPLPLDPGPHKISATAPGREPWEISVRLEQPGTVVNVDVPPLLERKAGAVPVPPPPGNGAPPGAVPPPEPPGSGAPPPPPPPEGGSKRPWQMPLGIAATVVGAGGLGTGVAFGFLAKSAFNQSNQGNCSATTNVCTNATGLSQRSDAVNKGNIGTGVFVAGAVVAAAGIVIWITAPSSHVAAGTGAATPPRIRLPQLGLGPTGASLRSTW